MMAVIIGCNFSPDDLGKTTRRKKPLKRMNLKRGEGRTQGGRRWARIVRKTTGQG